MLAGDPPFTGSTPQAILGRIVLGKPTPLREHRPSVPEHVAAAATKALEKVPADRFRTGADFARALGDAAFRWPVLVSTERRILRPLVLAGATGAVATALLFVLWSARAPEAQDAAPARTALSFSFPEDQLLAPGNPSTLEISPDGARLAYVADRGNNRSIFVRELSGFDTRALDGTEGATSVFFSPDGTRIGFYVDGELRSVPVEGGLSARIASVPTPPVGVSWSEDGTILYAVGGASVWRVDAAGGVAAEIPLVVDTAFAYRIRTSRCPPGGARGGLSTCRGPISRS